MSNALLSQDGLHQLIERFPNCRIAVLGDFFLDKYLDTDPALVETSVETGKEAHQVVRIRCSPGAAGTVVNNLASLNPGQLHAIGLTGDDGEAFELRRGLAARNCTTDHLIRSSSHNTPTYLKPRDNSIPGLDGEICRYDTKNRDPMSPELEAQLIQALDVLLPELDAVIILDQVEEAVGGVLSSAIRDAAIERAQRFPGVVFWVDSRERVHEFRRMTLKSNEYEVLGMKQPPPGTIIDLNKVEVEARKLRRRNGAPVVVTCGDKGVLISDPDWKWVPAVRVDGEIDATGAGDSFNAGATLALAAGASFAEATVVAHLVASITIQQLATTGVARPYQLPDRLSLWIQQQKE
ncbi:MAG: PfkB family carbohydrate kinase [Candidatus Poribacteria bacterium]|nr:PfkB family carbohydrate kinase [Candidatus Poribacteria bacterium]MDE0503014.1 PfkB family carbohydrate kinase [Candidatus Poribacteria bacterium]